MRKSFSFMELWEKVCARVPEADPDKVLMYLVVCIGIENGNALVDSCALEIEKRMIEKGEI